MQIIYKNTPFMACLALLLCTASCYEDKGNYDYAEVETIEIQIPDNIVAMSYAENIEIKPKVVSSVKGEISANDTDYEFGCKLNYRHQDPETGQYLYWLDIDQEGLKDVSYFANIPAGNYPVWYEVKNKKTGVTTNARASVSLLSPTYEGWMVLNNVGSDKKVRLDIISKNSQGEEMVAYGIQGDEVPTLADATQLVMNPSMYAGAEAVFLLSNTGGYRLDEEQLTISAGNNMKMTDFIAPSVVGEPVSMIIINNNNSYGPTSRLCVTDIGDAYAIASATAGASFETPMNAETVGGVATYKVSPFTGTSMARRGNSSCALLYDITNKRFVGWNYSAIQNKLLFSLADPEGVEKKYSFTTGMDIVTMVGTRYSDGLVYSVLQDARGHRHLYGINLSGSRFTQESIYDDIAEEHFDDAVSYAFHSQFPFMFYCYKNKVYSYNLGTGRMNDILTLNDNETVDLLKFNLFVNMNLANLRDHSDEFLAKQYQLIVASSTNAEDGGKVRFYDIDTSGKMTLANEYQGFGKVVDVTYRERR